MIIGRATRGAVSSSRATIATVTIRVSVEIPIHFAHIVALKPIVEVPSAHSEKIGCASLISSREGQGPEDQLAFDLAHWRAKPNDEVRFCAMWRNGLRRQVPSGEHLRVAPDHRALDDIAQLSNVSGPPMSSEGIQAVLANTLNSFLVFPVEFLDEVLDEQRQIFEPVAQRRQLNGVNVETVVEVLAQSPLADRLLQRTIGCGEDAHVDWQLFACAEPENSLLFENTEQLGLHLRPHLGNLVEQEAATIRPLEASLAAPIGACKGPAFVAEKFAFDQAFRDSGAVDCYVRSVLARRLVVDRARGQLFPRTALAGDDHRRARRSGFFDQAYGQAYR
jgi:hypothetical protein